MAAVSRRCEEREAEARAMRAHMVGRCRVTVANPVLKAHTSTSMVSALEARI